MTDMSSSHGYGEAGHDYVEPSHGYYGEPSRGYDEPAEGRWTRDDRVDFLVKVLIWATIATVAAIAFAVGLFITRELLGAIASLALPIAVVSLAWAAWVHHRIRALERRMDLELL